MIPSRRHKSTFSGLRQLTSPFVPDVSSKANCDHRSFLAVEDPPPPPQNKRLLVDLHKQNQNLEAKCETKGTALKIKHEDQELPSLEGCELRESCGLSTYLCKAKVTPPICNIWKRRPII